MGKAWIEGWHGKLGRVVCLVVVLLGAGLPVALAGDLDLDPALTPGEFEELADHLAEAVEMPAGTARALGPLGFQVQGGAFWVDADRDASWWRHGLGGASETLGGLAGVRAGFRKGLPGGFDLGLSAGTVAGETFLSGEIRGQLLSQSAVRPAVGVRAVWSELTSGPVDLSVYSLGMTASRRFVLLTPYATLGIRRVEAGASWGEPSARHHVQSTTLTASAGAYLSIPPLGLRLELRRGTATAGFVGLGFRF